MKAILDKLNDVCLLADKRVKEAETQAVSNKQKGEELKDKLAKSVSKEADLKVREGKLVKVESAVELKAKNESLLREITARQKQLTLDRAAHQDRVTNELADIATRKANLESNLKAFEEQKGKVQTDLTNQILKELTAKLKK